MLVGGSGTGRSGRRSGETQGVDPEGVDTGDGRFPGSSHGYMLFFWELTRPLERYRTTVIWLESNFDRVLPPTCPLLCVFVIIPLIQHLCLVLGSCLFSAS